MKKIKLLFVFLFSILLFGCTTEEINETINSLSSQVSQGVNMDDLGNIMNGQYYFDDGEQQFYSTFDESGDSHIYMTKGGTTRSIFDGFGWSFALKGDYLYFSGNEGVKIDNTYNLFRMNLTDGTYERINTGYCFNMYFYDNYLYYVKENAEDVYSIHRSNLDGTNEVQLVNTNSYSSIVYEKKLYYLSDDYVYQAEPDGSNAKVILNDEVAQFIIGQGKIIYLDLDDNIKVSDVDGKNINTVRMSDGTYISKINSYKENIFYVVYSDSYLSDRMAYPYNIYKLSMTTSSDTLVYSGVSWGYYVNIVKDKIYVLDYAQDLTINKFIAITSNMNLDGSNITRLYRK